MSAELHELPLYPLNTVLFPHAKLMIHVADEQQAKMVAECQRESRRFGVVLRREEQGVAIGDTYLVGTLAEVLNIEHHPDGQIGATIRGGSRFRVRRFEDSQTILTGRVEPVSEVLPEESPRGWALSSRAKEAAENYIQSCFSGLDLKVSGIKLPSDPFTLSFLVAGLLNVDSRRKQLLLETTDTLERLAEMIPLLEEQTMTGSESSATRASAAELLRDVSSN
jgi:Lon protease-like protein